MRNDPSTGNETAAGMYLVLKFPERGCNAGHQCSFGVFQTSSLETSESFPQDSSIQNGLFLRANFLVVS